MVLVEAGAGGEVGRLGSRVPEEGVEYGVARWGGSRSIASGGGTGCGRSCWATYMIRKGTTDRAEVCGRVEGIVLLCKAWHIR